MAGSRGNGRAVEHFVVATRAEDVFTRPHFAVLEFSEPSQLSRGHAVFRRRAACRRHGARAADRVGSPGVWRAQRVTVPVERKPNAYQGMYGHLSRALTTLGTGATPHIAGDAIGRG